MKKEMCISKQELENAMIELKFARLKGQDVRGCIDLIETLLNESKQKVFNFVGD